MSIIIAVKMAAARLIGPLDEQLVLCTHVLPTSKVAKWLAAIEQSMKTSIQFALEACLTARLEDGKYLYITYLMLSLQCL